MAGRFSIEAVFRAIDRVTAPVSKMQNRVAKFTRSFKRGLTKLNRMTDNLAHGLRRVGIAAAASMLLAGTAIADVVNTGMEFEQTLVNAAAKYPGEIRKGTEAFKQLEDIARKTGATTEFTASQAAEGLNFLAMAGFDAQQSVAALPRVVDLATAAQVDLATASDIATDSLGAFGLATKDATQLGKNLNRVNDVMAKTVTTANTNMEQLFEAIKDGGPVATGAGASMETFNAMVGELANAGIKGTKAGTTLKNMFLRLSAPVGAGADALKQLGVATKDSQGNLRDMFDILEDLNTAIGKKGLGSADKAAVLNDIFGLRAVAGANVLLSVGTDRLREYRKQLLGATGASETMAEVMRDTTKGSFLTLKSAIESVKISLFKLRQGEINKLIQKATDWVRSVDKLINSNEELANKTINEVINKVIFATKVFAGLVATVIVLKTVVLLGNSALIIYNGTMLAAKVATVAWAAANTLLTSGLKVARTAMIGFSIAASANPIGLIIAAIVALIAIIVLLVKNWDVLKEKFLALPTPVRAALTIAFLPLVLAIGLIRKLVEVFESAGPLIEAAVNFISDHISKRIEFIKNIFVAFFSLFGGVGESIISIFKRVGDFIGGVVDKILSFSPILTKIIEKVADFGGKMLFGVDSDKTNVDKVPVPITKQNAPDNVSNITNILRDNDTSGVLRSGPDAMAHDPQKLNNLVKVSFDPSKVSGRSSNTVVDNSVRSVENIVNTVPKEQSNVFNIADFMKKQPDSLTGVNGPINTEINNIENVTNIKNLQEQSKPAVPQKVINQGDVTNLFTNNSTPTQSVNNFGSANDDSADDKVSVLRSPQVITPQERVARTIEEHRETSSAELTIRDETGRAELKENNKTKHASIKLASSGSF